MKRLFVALLPTVMLALVGCSGNPATSAPESTPTSESPAGGAPTASSPSASPSSAVPATCLRGRYRLVRFVGVGDKGTFGTGEGEMSQSPSTKGRTCCAAQEGTDQTDPGGPDGRPARGWDDQG